MELHFGNPWLVLKGKYPRSFVGITLCICVVHITTSIENIWWGCIFLCHVSESYFELPKMIWKPKTWNYIIWALFTYEPISN
jgi:hypothetical protein